LFDAPSTSCPVKTVRVLLNALAQSSSVLTDVSISGLFSRGLETRVAPLFDDLQAFLSARTNLRRLRFDRSTNRRMGIAHGIADALARSLLTSLDRLVLDDCGDGEALARALTRMCLLTQLVLAGTRVTANPFASVAKLTSLRVLNVRALDRLDNADHGPALIELLRVLPSLEQLECEGVHDPAALVCAVADGTALRRLFLTGRQAWLQDSKVIALPAMLALLKRNTTLHELGGMLVSTDEFLSDALVDAFENDNFSLHSCCLPPRVEEQARYMESRRRVVCALNRNARIVKWTAMRERVSEVAIGFADMRLPPYVLEEIINNEPDLTATRHWLKIQTLIAVQKFQNRLDALKDAWARAE
jgi:hypothetical protein